MGWKPLSECRLRFHGYEEARDVELPDDPPDTWFSLPPGTFAIFLPDDAHAPLACKGKVRKVVVKVRVEA
jgi:beta-galactosidase beta subunit